MNDSNLDDANREAARLGDRMSSSADERTTGSVNPIPPQPKHIPRGLGLRLGTIVIWAALIAVAIFLIWQLTQGGQN